jgi:hypothetical protein
MLQELSEQAETIPAKKILSEVAITMDDLTSHSKKTTNLFSNSSTKGSTGRRERTDRIRPLMKSSAHSSSSSCPTTKGAFPGLTY